MGGIDPPTPAAQAGPARRPLPVAIRVTFPRSYLDGNPPPGAAATWDEDVPVSSLGYIPDGPAWPLAVLHDRRFAEFDSRAVSVPRNRLELRGIAQRVATDWCAWRAVAYDRNYWGILDWTPDGSANRVVWTYRKDDVSTRVMTDAWNGAPEEVHHGPNPDESITILEDLTCYAPTTTLKAKYRTLTLRDRKVVAISDPTTVDAGCCACSANCLAHIEILCRSWTNAYGGSPATSSTAPPPERAGQTWVVRLTDRDTAATSDHTVTYAPGPNLLGRVLEKDITVLTGHRYTVAVFTHPDCYEPVASVDFDMHATNCTLANGLPPRLTLLVESMSISLSGQVNAGCVGFESPEPCQSFPLDFCDCRCSEGVAGTSVTVNFAWGASVSATVDECGYWSTGDVTPTSRPGVLAQAGNWRATVTATPACSRIGPNSYEVIDLGGNCGCCGATLGATPCPYDEDVPFPPKPSNCGPLPGSVFLPALNTGEYCGCTYCKEATATGPSGWGSGAQYINGDPRHPYCVGPPCLTGPAAGPNIYCWYGEANQPDIIFVQNVSESLGPGGFITCPLEAELDYGAVPIAAYLYGNGARSYFYITYPIGRIAGAPNPYTICGADCAVAPFHKDAVYNFYRAFGPPILNERVVNFSSPACNRPFVAYSPAMRMAIEGANTGRWRYCDGVIPAVGDGRVGERLVDSWCNEMPSPIVVPDLQAGTFVGSDFIPGQPPFSAPCPGEWDTRFPSGWSVEHDCVKCMSPPPDPAPAAPMIFADAFRSAFRDLEDRTDPRSIEGAMLQKLHPFARDPQAALGPRGLDGPTPKSNRVFLNVPPEMAASNSPPPKRVEGRINVAFVGPHAGDIGGTETWHRVLLPELAKRWDFHILGYGVALSSGSRTLDEIRLRGIPAYVGQPSIEALVAEADIVVAWGAVNFLEKGRPGLRVIWVAHEEPEMGRTPKILADIDGKAHAFVAVSDSASRCIAAHRKADGRVIRNGVEPPNIAPAPLADRPEMLAFVGRLSPEKRPIRAVEALAHLPEPWTLEVCGEGPERGPMEKKAGELGIDDRVIFHGNTDPYPVLARAKATILPSVSEGFACAAIESWMHGAPLVITPVGMARSHADFVTPIGHDARGREIADAILAASRDQAKADLAREFSLRELSAERFAAEWAEFLTRESRAPGPQAKSPLEQVESCPFRSSCGCGSGLKDCAKGKGNAGKVSLADCLKCVKSGGPDT
jgi:glycosyltransferase involved in cell wall biosynthesis